MIVDEDDDDLLQEKKLFYYSNRSIYLRSRRNLQLLSWNFEKKKFHFNSIQIVSFFFLFFKQVFEDNISHEFNAETYIFEALSWIYSLIILRIAVHLQFCRQRSEFWMYKSVQSICLDTQSKIHGFNLNHLNAYFLDHMSW